MSTNAIVMIINHIEDQRDICALNIALGVAGKTFGGVKVEDNVKHNVDGTRYYVYAQDKEIAIETDDDTGLASVVQVLTKNEEGKYV